LHDPEPATQVRHWVDRVVIGLDLCPFAASPLRAGSVRFVCSRAESPQEILAEVLAEAQGLAAGDAGTTSLLVIPRHAEDFQDFLDLVQASEDLLSQTSLSDQIQLAHFHPDYVFAGAEANDPANATNRAPWPTLHLLRTADVASAIAAHGNVSDIPSRNAELMRRLSRDV
jgi:hypothetical protein